MLLSYGAKLFGRSMVDRCGVCKGVEGGIFCHFSRHFLPFFGRGRGALRGGLALGEGCSPALRRGLCSREERCVVE